jgi:hypothetical protein
MKDILDLKTVESYFEHIKLFILDLMICIDNIEAIIKARDENVNLYPTREFIGHYVYLSYSHAAINIYKIFKAEEKRSFQKLFNKFKNYRYSEDFRNLLTENSLSDDKNLIQSKDELKAVIAEIENQIIQQHLIITKINRRRETFYAHTDPDVKIESESLSDLKLILELSKKIYNNLYGKLYSRYYMFYHSEPIITSIIEDRKFVDDYWKNEEAKL